MAVPLFLLLLGVVSARLNLTDGDFLINFVNSRQSTWKAHHNFDQKTLPLYAAKLAGEGTESPTGVSDGYDGDNVFVSKRVKRDDVTIPDTFDARDQWKNCSSIGKVRDQGPCSSGWAIASVTALTDRFCIASDGAFTKEFSAQQLLECCTMCGNCKTGYSKTAWYYIAFNGIITGGGYQSNEGCKPYDIAPCEHSIFKSNTLNFCTSVETPEISNCQNECTSKNYGGNYATDVHFVQTVTPLNTVNEIQKEIVTGGPVQATINIYEDMLYYKTGVYSHLTGNKIGSHAVKIIGWGEENSTSYWLVVNSWNTNWGESGLFKILRGQNECGIETSVYSPTPDLTIFKK